MLRHLKISNFALIEELDIAWQAGFTTITGETGAGKSIMLGALNHLLGQRADLKALKNPDQKCIIEGIFALQKESYQALFESLELDYEPETIIRREILPSGKSRAFVNDSPVRLESLSELTRHLIDIHSQHDTLLLNDSRFQLDLIDSFGNHQAQLDDYQSTFKSWKQAQAEWQSLKETNASEGGDLDYLEFLHQELEEAKLIPGEFEDIEAKLDNMEHSGKIDAALSSIEQLANAEPLGLSDMLRQLQTELKSIANYHPKLQSFSERAQSLLIEYEDLRQELEAYATESQFDPQEKEQLDQRMSQLIHLQRKHQLDQAEDLIATRDALDAKMQAAADREVLLQKLEAQIKDLEEQLTERAEVLHHARMTLKPKLEKAVLDLLKDLNMSAASFEIEISRLEKFDSRGNNQLQFLFSANPGQAMKPLQKVASGGELSRVMLSLKAILATSQNLPSIIFDEIDTGVSGETALKIGDILKTMGQSMQVIAISHLAQIASKGGQHYLVKKEMGSSNTRTDIIPLEGEQRLREVARLLAGDTPSEAALANARELIEAN
jgi:DNA repair protein RecN (Recombination protein N)